MKLFTPFAVLMLLVITPIFSQVAKENASAVLIGPVIIDGEIGATIGYSKNIGSGFHLVSLGRFGETVEAEGELLKLFKVIDKLYIGPIAGGGIDWSDEAGTGGVPTTSYVFGATGAAATYAVIEHLGAWAFWKRHITEEFNDPTVGIGLYYKF